ncbi:MAG: hypothetical protein M1368_05125, partial [Thaumarchaeota archaeon]|nr:hypothetical protein [Nitrososphaerota archaeon]
VREKVGLEIRLSELYHFWVSVLPNESATFDAQKDMCTNLLKVSLPAYNEFIVPILNRMARVYRSTK